jgi:hypothetical protein
MAFLITSQSSTVRILSSNILKTTTLAADVAKDIIDEDNTAIKGRRLLSINNQSETHGVKIAIGRTATATDYDFELPIKTQIIDCEITNQKYSAISEGALTIITSVANYI